MDGVCVNVHLRSCSSASWTQEQVVYQHLVFPIYMYLSICVCKRNESVYTSHACPLLRYVDAAGRNPVAILFVWKSHTSETLWLAAM